MSYSIKPTKAGPMDYLYICDVNAVEKIFRTEGKYPQRMLIDSWVKWREEKGHDKGILIE